MSLHSVSFFVLNCTIIVLGMWEFYGLLSKTGVQPQKILGIITGVVIFTANFLLAAKYTEDNRIFLFAIPLLILIFIVELYRQKDQPFNNISFTLFGISYIALPFSLLNYFAFNKLTNFQFDPKIVLGFIFLIWLNDTGAYLSGMTLGKHKLFERISPKKTWEGSIGGALFTCLAAFVISLFFKELTTLQWIIMSPIVVLTGTFGDLAESLFKRSINIKDSGNILPGHGGILDRFDSLFLSIPAGYIYLQLI